MNITQEELRALTNQACFERGRDYFKDGLVELISIRAHQVTAYVIATRAYIVSLNRIGQIIKGYCNCPAFEEFGTCKHLAATGFALISHYEGRYHPSEEYFKKAAFFRDR